jgi:hypothetical protein
MGGSGDNAFLDGATVLRLDVYGASAHCADGVLVAGAGAPIMSHTYSKGQAISLDVPPGPHALVLTTFSDDAATMPLGVGCTEANLQAGSQICFDLSIVAAPQPDDLSSISCSTAPDSCPAGQYCDGANCVPGCKTSADCGGGPDGGTTTTPICDPSSHQCIACLVPTDCPTGYTCTGKQCVPTCPAGQKQCNGTCIGAATCCTAADCGTPPTPSACYAASCPTPGAACQYNVKAGAQVCGSTCCLPINGACNADCTLACNAGAGDCDGNRANGCETSTTTTSNCGGCGNVCDTTHSQGATCMSGSCKYTSCSTGYANCDTTAPDTNGCETHTDVDSANCGACGRACSNTHVATAHCSAGTCDSTCQANFGNCNRPAAGATAPYTADDGCESDLTVCTGQACCTMTSPAPAGMCVAPSTGANAHVNGPASYGLGQNYADCHALGTPGDPTTYTQTMALAAQAAAPGTNKPSQFCGTATCLNKLVNGVCVVWCYQDDTTGSAGSVHLAGHVFANTSSMCKYCPIEGDPTWN